MSLEREALQAQFNEEMRTLNKNRNAEISVERERADEIELQRRALQRKFLEFRESAKNMIMEKDRSLVASEGQRTELVRLQEQLRTGLGSLTLTLEKERQTFREAVGTLSRYGSECRYVDPRNMRWIWKNCRIGL